MPYIQEQAESEIHDCIKLSGVIVDSKTFFPISHFLGGGKMHVKPELIKIEKDLAVQVGNDVDAVLKYFREQKDRELAKNVAKKENDDPPAPRPFSGLLTKHLAVLETANGFNPQMYSTFLRGLSPKAFLDDTTKNKQFKDLISPKHGEYTHRMQFYMVMQFGAIPNGNGKAVFESILKVKGLWDILFDRLPGDEPFQWGSEDYRRPENLNDYLISGEFAESCPLLGTFFKGRYDKRAAGPPYGQSPEARNKYIARKMFNLSYEQCTPAQKLEISKVGSILERNKHA